MTTITTPAQLKRYKKVLVFFSIILLGFVVLNISRVISGEGYLYLIAIPFLLIFAWNMIRERRMIRSIAFDENSLYYQSADEQSVKIPFDNIRTITYGRFDGIHRINLKKPNEIGKAVYFKTSLNLPFNIDSNDPAIFQLKEAIDTYNKPLEKAYENEFQITREVRGLYW